MATDYVDAIARALQEYQTGIPVPSTSIPEQIYSDLAWGGLSDAPVFDATYPVGNPSRQRILNRYEAEQRNLAVPIAFNLAPLVTNKPAPAAVWSPRITTPGSIVKTAATARIPSCGSLTELEQQRFDAALRRKQLSLVLAGKMKPEEATELKALFI